MSHFSPATSSPRHALRLAILGLCALAAISRSALAVPTLGITQSSFLDLAPGQSFTVQFDLENPDPITIVAYDFFVSASQAGVFSITAQQLSGAVDQPNSTATLPYAVTTGADTNDFGAFNSSGTEGFGTGTFTVQTLTFQVSPSASAGAYTISIGWNQPSLTGGPSLLDAELNEYQMSMPIGIAVTVVPEPRTTAFLLVGGLLALVLLRWRLARGRR